MKLGLFGGSFNPIHNGHIDMARRAREQFGLDRVLLMVAKDPPHKEIAGNVHASARLLMAEAALAGEDGLAVSGLELAREGKSYTVETVRALQDELPDAEIYLIVGEDMLNSLDTWREAESLLRRVTVIAVARPGVEGALGEAAEALRRRFSARIAFAAFTGRDVSSTLVRARVRDAQPIDGLTPPAVERMIYEGAYYQPEEIAQMQEKLRISLNKKRYEHSVGAMRAAISLAARWGVDGRAARLAALLHDCARFEPGRLVAIAEEYGVPMDEYEREAPLLLHDKLGALIARDAYGITDPAVLDAIRRHQLCGAGMSTLAKIVYLADKIEPTRDYPGVETLRALASKDLDRAVLACMDSVHGHLVREGKRIKPEGEAARAAFRAELRSKRGENA